MKKLLIFLISLILATPAVSSTVNLSWDNNPDASGYKIFKSLTSGTYDYNSPDWTGIGENTIITDLENSTEYFFVIRAFNSCGNESEDSKEISHITEPMCGNIITVTGVESKTLIIIK